MCPTRRTEAPAKMVGGGHHIRLPKVAKLGPMKPFADVPVRGKRPALRPCEANARDHDVGEGEVEELASTTAVLRPPPCFFSAACALHSLAVPRVSSWNFGLLSTVYGLH